MISSNFLKNSFTQHILSFDRKGVTKGSPPFSLKTDKSLFEPLDNILYDI